MLLYVLAAPAIHDRYFARNAGPLQADAYLPPISESGHANVDAVELVDDQQGIYLIAGWGFVAIHQDIPAGDYERQLVLASTTRNYLFAAATNERPDVQRYFLLGGLSMDLDLSGFVSYVSRNALAADTYAVGLLLTDIASRQSYYVGTGRCLTRTPNTLVLEQTGHPACTAGSAARIGQPLQVDAQLPPATTGAKMGIDALTESKGKPGLYELVGWGFATAKRSAPGGAFQRQLALLSAHGNYIFEASTVARPDVQQYFNYMPLDLGLSGFSAFVDAATLPPGVYSIGLVLTLPHSSEAYLIEEAWCLRSTGERLILEPFGSPICRSD
jgi:hypothetical protein